MMEESNGGGPGQEPETPQAWTWSHYKSAADDSPGAEGSPRQEPASAAAPEQAGGNGAAPSGGSNSNFAALGLAAAIVVIGGLTWLFTTKDQEPKPAPAATEEALPAIRTGTGATTAPPPAPAAPEASGGAPAPAASEPAAPAGRHGGPVKRGTGKKRGKASRR